MGRLALDVAEQERVDPAGARGEDDAGVVGHRPVGDAPPRAPHHGVDLADGEAVASVQGDHRDAVPRGHAVDGLRHRAGSRTGPTSTWATRDR